MYLFFDYNSHAANFSPQLKEADTLPQKYQDTQIPIVALNQEEDEIDKTKGLAIRIITEQMLPNSFSGKDL